MIAAVTILASLLSGPPNGYWRLAEVTAYCPCALCTPGLGVTADGTKVNRTPYGLAADRWSFPSLGASVYLAAGFGALDRLFPTSRALPVDDRGGALDREAGAVGRPRLDLRVKEHAWALRFGRRLIPFFTFYGPTSYDAQPFPGDSRPSNPLPFRRYP